MDLDLEKLSKEEVFQLFLAKQKRSEKHQQEKEDIQQEKDDIQQEYEEKIAWLTH